MPLIFDEKIKQVLEELFPQRVREPTLEGDKERFIQIKIPNAFRNIHYELHNRINKISRKKVGRIELHIEGRGVKNQKSKESKVIKIIVQKINEKNITKYGAKDCSYISKNIYQFRFWLDKDIDSLEAPNFKKELVEFVSFFDNIFGDLIKHRFFEEII